MAVVALVVATWVLATVFESPEQREANAAAPAPQPVFAAVTTGVLADTRSYSGTIAYSDEVGFTLPAGAEAVRSIVTGRAVTAGGTVDSGDVLTEVNTRPVFLVASPFDFFRDISFGDDGADVRVLQEALVGRGYLGSADGKYGGDTARAVAHWYRDAGYDAPTKQRPETGTDTTSTNASGTRGSSDPAAPSQSSGSETAGGTSNPVPKPVLDAFVPLSELLAVPSLPATVVTALTVGTHVAGKTTDITLGATELIVRAEAPTADTAGLAPGDPVTVLAGTDKVDGVLARVENRPAADDGTPQPSVLEVSFEKDASVLASHRGESVTVTVQDAVVAGESLIVPTAAVVGRGEKQGVVVKRQDDGSLVEVPLTVDGSLRGMTAVTPDDNAALVEGDDVRVG